jgi:ribonuclease P protein component
MANRFGKAVERTRFRRCVREAFRLSELRDMQGFDVHVRVTAKDPDGFHDLQKLFARIAQILKKN